MCVFDVIVICASVGFLVKEAKANVNAKDKDSTTALMAAAVRGHKEVRHAAHELIVCRPDACRLHRCWCRASSTRKDIAPAE